LERLGRDPGHPRMLESAVDEETFVNFLAQHLDVPPLEKQALLEAATLGERARRLRDVLEFRLEELRAHPGGMSGRAH
jgi:Lon protease-like protein